MPENISLDQVLDAAILPILPAVALKILTLEPETEAADMARIISQDPSLSARILKAANSPLYATLTPVGNIKRAVILLGDRQVKTLALAFSLIPLRDAELDFSRFWEHSLVTAIATRRVLKHTCPRHAEDGFTAGLLANIGAVLLAGAYPAQYLDILKKCQGQPFSLKKCERETFGFDHGELGVAAAKRWRFPESFQAVLAHHNDAEPFQGEGEVALIVQAAYLAGMLADLFYSKHPAIVKKAILKAKKQMAGLADFSLDELEEGIEDEIHEASDWMGIHVRFDKPLTEILEEANRRLVAINTEYEETVQWLYRSHIDLIQASKKHTSGENL